MSKLPYSRVVNVTLSRTDNFPTRRGFGTQLILTGTEVSGEVDGTNRTKLYATMEEVAADFASGTEVYAAALAAFSRNPRPLRLKVGYIDWGGSLDAAAIQAELDALYDYDQAWYMLTIEATMRDDAKTDGIVAWIEAKPKVAMIDSNDALMEDPLDATNIAARHKGTVERTAIFYHRDAGAYLASSISGYMATRNLDDANSAYTAKFKDAPGINNVDLASSELTAVTGFVEATGQSETAGHLANTYIDIGNQNFLVEGSMLTQNVFLDEIHSTDWIIARTEEEALAMLLNNARIPYTDQGMEQLASVPRAIMQLAVRAGIVAQDLNPTTGEFEPAYTITVPSVFDVPEAQRKARIAPAIAVRFRYSGAVHYTTVNYTMTF